jgi:BirA family biotin operon repressor/biotin-[acetyl-CoA-carboxylase] ligase
LDCLRRALVQGGRFAQVDVVDEVGSTNAALLAAVRDSSPPHLSALLAEHQTAGRGRLDRAWEAAPRTSVLASVLLRPPPDPPLALSLLALVAGLAACRALAAFVPSVPRVVWPNDVVVAAPPAGLAPALHDPPGWGRWRKIAGILVQAAPHTGAEKGGGRAAIVLGVGVNVTQTPRALPVPWATSVRAASGQCPDRTLVAAALLTAVASHYEAWGRGEPHLRPMVEARCLSVGQDVAVEQPGGASLTGRGICLDDDGALVLATPAGRRAVVAGDARALRKILD